jgi:hypothetical protein
VGERESYSRAKEAASERRMEKRERADSSEREAESQRRIEKRVRGG